MVARLVPYPNRKFDIVDFSDLSSMVAKLVQYPNLKFIWAEISYLSMWWAEQDQQVGHNDAQSRIYDICSYICTYIHVSVYRYSKTRHLRLLKENIFD